MALKKGRLQAWSRVIMALKKGHMCKVVSAVPPTIIALKPHSKFHIMRREIGNGLRKLGHLAANYTSYVPGGGVAGAPSATLRWVRRFPGVARVAGRRILQC